MALNTKLQLAISEFARKLREYTLTEDLPDLEAAFARLAAAIAEQALQPTTDNVQIIIDPANTGTSSIFRISHDSPDSSLSETLFTVNELKQAILEGELLGGVDSLVLTSRTVDGAGAIAIDLNAANLIGSDTSKLLRLRSGGIERLAIEHAASAYDASVSQLLTLRKEDGSLAFQWDLAGSILYSPAGLTISRGPTSGTSLVLAADGSATLSGGGSSVGLAADGSAQYVSDVADSASAVAHLFDTVSTLATPGALIFAVREAGVDVFTIDRDHNIAVDGTVDGRDVAADGSALDGHLDGTGTKHNADEVAVVGTYANIPGTPTDLESTISAIDTIIGAESLWDRTLTVLSPQNVGDSLDMGTGGYTSSVADGASAVGFLFNSANSLVTAGSKLLSLQNASIEYANVRRGSDLWGSAADNTLLELSDKLGARKMQLVGGAYPGMYIDQSVSDAYPLVHVSDYTYAPGWGEVFMWSAPAFGAGTTSMLQVGVNKDVGGAMSGSSLIIDARDGLLGNIKTNVSFTLSDTGKYVRFNLHQDRDWAAINPMELEVENDDTLGPGGLGVMSVNFGVDHYGRLFGRSVQGETWGFRSGVFDGSTAVAYDLDTTALVATPGAKLLSLKTATSEKFAVDKDGNISVVGTVDGRDVSLDGSVLDGHLDGGSSKHNASEINVTGTYVNIAGTPTDLESTISAIDSWMGTEDLWSRTGTVLSPQNAGDSLDMAGGGYASSVADGATAVGFAFVTDNSLATDGSKVLSLKNASVEMLNVRQGNNLRGEAAAHIVDLYNVDGLHLLQLSAQSTGLGGAMEMLTVRPVTLESGTDPTLSGTYTRGFVSITPATAFINIMAEDTNTGGTGYFQTQPTAAVMGATNGAYYSEFAILGATWLTKAVKAYIHINGGDAYDPLLAFSGVDGKMVGAEKTISPAKWALQSLAINGASSIGFELSTLNSFTSASSKLLSIKNATTEVLAVDKDGHLKATQLYLQAAQPDAAGSVSHILNQVPVLSSGTATLLSVRNNDTEKFWVGATGKVIMGGTPGYTPQPTAGLVANYSLIEIGDGTSNVGLEFKSGAAGAYISDGSLFWVNFEKSPQQIRFSQPLTFSNNVGIIYGSQVNGGAGAGSPNIRLSSKNALATAGDRLVSIDNNGVEKAYFEYDGTLYLGGINTSSILKSREDDGSTSVAFILDTVNSLANASAKLLSVRNATSEKLAIDKDGNIVTSGANSTWVVRPSEGGAGIQAALTAANAAGGGIVQLLAGTYVASAQITGTGLNNVILQGVGDATVIQHDNSGTFILLAYSVGSGSYSYNGNNVTRGDTSVYTTTPSEAGNILAGDILVLRGTDADGILDLEMNEALSNGNGTTGEIALKSKVIRTMTSVSIRTSRNGRNNIIRNLKLVSTGSNGSYLAYLFGNNLLVEDVHVKGGWATGAYGAFQLSAAITGTAGTNNTVRHCTFEECQAAAIGLFHQIGATVEGCTFKNTGAAGSAYDGAIVVERECRDTLIKSNYITNVIIGHGVRANGTIRRRTKVLDNWLFNCYNGGVTLDGEAEICDNHIEGCGLGATSAFSGSINAGGKSNVITGNVLKTSRYGIQSAAGGDYSVISNNKIEDMTDAGIYAGGISQTVSGNITKDITAGYGIYIYGQSQTVTGNAIDNTSNYGLYIGAGSNHAIANNTGTNIVATGLVLAAVVSGCTVVGNNFNGEGITNSGTNNDLIANKS